VFRLLTLMLFSRCDHQGAVEGPANGRGRNGRVPVPSEKPEELPDLVVQERRRDQSAKRQVRNFFLFSIIWHLPTTLVVSTDQESGIL